MPERAVGPDPTPEIIARDEVMARAVHDEEPHRDLELQARQADRLADAATEGLVDTVSSSLRRRERMLAGSRLAILESHADGELMGGGSVERALMRAENAETDATIKRRVVDGVMDEAGTNYDNGEPDKPINVPEIRAEATHEVALEGLRAKVAELERRVDESGGLSPLRHPVKWFSHVEARSALAAARAQLAELISKQDSRTERVQ